MNSVSRDRFLLIAALAAPFLGVQALRFIPMSSGPAPASAAGEISIFGTQELTDVNLYSFEIPRLEASDLNNPVAKLYRAAHQKSFERVPIASTPRVKSNAPTVVAEKQPETPDEKLVEAQAILKSLELTSILSGREPIAVIAGRPLRAGAMVKKGWKLIEIDLARSTATVEHPLAGKATLALKRRAPKSEDSGVEPVSR